MESIEKTEDIFPFKTKGILLSVLTPPEKLERKRYRLDFKEGDEEAEPIQGILDGGHNMLAIALHILRKAREMDNGNEASETDNESNSKSQRKAERLVKLWEDLKPVWEENREKIEKIRSDLKFLVPIEILSPAVQDEEQMSEEEQRREFVDSIPDICAARNNNVQLTKETIANQSGFYELLKDVLDEKLKDEVIWRTNTPGRIPVRDLIALAWIPLSKLKMPEGIASLSPVQLYRNKGKCIETYVDLMSNKEVSNYEKGKYELKNTSVESALQLMKDLPRLYDKIYEQFPEAYNDAGGKFGRITAVKMYEPKKYKDDKKRYLGKKALTPYYKKEMDYNIPDGFVMPLFYGLSTLIEVKSEEVEEQVKENGNQVRKKVLKQKVGWKTDPFDFIEKNLSEIVDKTFQGIMNMCGFDPQKVGKEIMSYNLVQQQFEFLFAKENQNEGETKNVSPQSSHVA